MTLPIVTSPLTAEYGWNETSKRYIDLDTGQFVSFSSVRDALEETIDAAKSRMDSITQSLIDGNVTLEQWQRDMMSNIKVVNTASAASANGGWAQMTQSDWGFVGSQIKDQYKYLQNFANQIANGEQALDGRALVRAGMYGDAGRSTFEEMRRRSAIESGMDEGRRVLGSADHCDDCIEYASEGWMPAEDVPPIGDSQCKTNCHCTIEYRNSVTGETNE